MSFTRAQNSLLVLRRQQDFDGDLAGHGGVVVVPSDHPRVGGVDIGGGLVPASLVPQRRCL